MAYFQFRYPRPQIVGRVDPAVFEGIRAESSPLDNLHFLLYVDGDGTLYEDYMYPTQQNRAALEAAKHITTIALEAMEPERVILSDVVVRRRPQESPDSWHRDGFKSSKDRGFVVSDKNPTQFVHGIHMGIDLNRARNQHRHGVRVAESLTSFIPNPYEVAMFERRTLHKRPDEGTDDRIFIRAVLLSIKM
jgi:hypothetical protein